MISLVPTELCIGIRVSKLWTYNDVTCHVKFDTIYYPLGVIFGLFDNSQPIGQHPIILNSPAGQIRGTRIVCLMMNTIHWYTGFGSPAR